MIASVLLYLLWYVLWFLWNLKTGNNKLWFVVLLFGFLGFFYGILFLYAPENIEEVRRPLMIRILLAGIVFSAVQYALKAQTHISQLRIDKEQLQTEKYKVQLKALQAQIDPHFLFNSLNTLRSMVRQKHVHSEQFVLSLSDFYRQTLKHNESTTLALSEELAVLESYLFLMKSRNEKAVSIKLTIDESLEGYHLPTLALQVVVENCFKHNSMTAKMPLQIEITDTDDSYIEISNNLQPKIANSEESGFGLESLRKRYELMDVEEGLIIQETPNRFIVKLKLIDQ